MRLKEIKEIKGTLKILTGLRIGGSLDVIEIGGNDNPIIRNPLNNEPYIPGSSIKGKMRSLLEWNLGKIDSKGNVHQCKNTDCPICRMFGRGAVYSKKAKSGPTRLVVRDAYLKKPEQLENLRRRTGQDTEMKYENSINRLNSSAMPRNTERIPAGIEFEFSMSYKIMDLGDNGKIDEEYLENIKKGLKLLTLDGIGGGVSRGNGQIELDLEIDGEKVDLDSIEI